MYIVLSRDFFSSNFCQILAIENLKKKHLILALLIIVSLFGSMYSQKKGGLPKTELIFFMNYRYV